MSTSNATIADSSPLQRNAALLKSEYMKNLFAVSASVLGSVLAELIDTIFVSRRLGPTAMAAVNMSMPLYLILCCIGSLLAGGGFVLASRQLGLSNPGQAESLCRTSFLYTLAAGLLLTLIGLPLARPLADLVGGGGALSDMIYTYVAALLPFSVAFTELYIPSFFLQLDGKTTQITIMTVIMIALNAFLNWLFMFVFDFGLTGAALASGLSTLAAAIYGLAELNRPPTSFSLRRLFAKRSGAAGNPAQIIRDGSPFALGNLCDAARLLLLNSIILSWGGEKAAIEWAVLNTFFELSLTITSGVPQAGAPMMGVFSGARENSGIRILNKLECRAGLAASAVFTVLLLLFEKPIGVLFRISGTSDMHLPFLCLGVTVALQLLSTVWSTLFQSSGRIFFSNFLVLLRRFLLPVLTAWILMPSGAFFWLFLPVSALLTLAVGLIATWGFSRHTKNTQHALSPVLLLDDYLVREHKVLDFSIRSDVKEICSASERIADFCASNDMPPGTVMRLQLSVEELLTVIRSRNPKSR